MGSVSIPVGRDFTIAEDLASVRVDSVTGEVDADLLGIPSFELSAKGSLNIALGEDRTYTSPLTLAISNGSLSIEGALLEEELVAVDPYLKLTRVGLEEDSLSVEGKVQLPEPFHETPKALDEPTGLSFGGVGTLDLTYLALNLDFGSISSSCIDAVMDFYIENKRIDIGSKSSPG